MRVLHAWEDGGLVGRFTECADGITTFAYSEAASGGPISLSLPRSGDWAPEAPSRFLDGLLPDNMNARWAMKDATRAASVEPFDLLDKVDAVGGLTFSHDPEPPARDFQLVPMSEYDIEARIRKLSLAPDAWWVRDERCRFSLAGAQGKFAMASVEGGWYWPSDSLPSTHIVKPDSAAAPLSGAIEDATMTLAGLCGLGVPSHGILRARSARAYMVERFDRVSGTDGHARRLRTEDLAQALGVSRREKYDVEICDVIELLRAADPTDELAYAWLDQVAFNAAVGNGDAHAKNYSLLLEGECPRLSPLYDALVIARDQYDRSLAMTVNEKYYPEDLGPEDWGAQADACGLDAARVSESAMRMSEKIVDFAGQAFGGLDRPDYARAMVAIGRANARMLPRRG